MKKIFYFIIILAVIFNFSACINEKFSENPLDKLAFSADTLSFDTLFSTIPSYTAEMMIYNRNNKALKISQIYLENGANSVFRFNLDGFVPNASKMLTDIEIAAHDSLFLLIEVTLNENNDVLPMYISDNLIFITNGNKQKVVLEAYSQDAVILRGVSLTQNAVFTAEKPYLVFNYLHIAAGKTLTLEAGTRIFMHKDAMIVADGNIISNGTENERVTIRGDRFDLAYINVPYDYLPAQWGMIYFQNETGENILKNTTIRSGTGILLYGNSVIHTKLRLENCVIHNMSSYGVFSQNGDLEVINSEISNCGNACIAVRGGMLKMAHSTIANYFDWATRNEPSVIITNYAVQDKILYSFPITSAVMENSIIFGNRTNELVLMDTIFENGSENIMFNLLISNCLIKAKKIERPELENIVWSYAGNQQGAENKRDTIFENPVVDFKNIKESGYYNFQLADKSRAKDIGNQQVAAQYPTDLLGKNRLADSKPDLGAYERIEN